MKIKVAKGKKYFDPAVGKVQHAKITSESRKESADYAKHLNRSLGQQYRKGKELKSWGDELPRGSLTKR